MPSKRYLLISKSKWVSFTSTRLFGGQEWGLAKKYHESHRMRKSVECLVSLVLIPNECTLLSFNNRFKKCRAIEEKISLGSSGRLGRCSKPVFATRPWNQHDASIYGGTKTKQVCGRVAQSNLKWSAFAHPSLGIFLAFSKVDCEKSIDCEVKRAQFRRFNKQKERYPMSEKQQ